MVMVGGIDIPRNDGSTPLFAAAACGQEVAVQWLLNKGADPNKARQVLNPQ